MSRKSRKPALKVHATPPAEERTADLAPELAPPMTSTLAPLRPDVAAAAQAVVDEKILEAAKPKPRRVGPLSKLERMLVDQANDAQAPLVAEHQRLAKRMGELRVAMARRDREVGQAILEGRGEGLAQDGEAVQLVEEGSDLFVQVVKIERAKA